MSVRKFEPVPIRQIVSLPCVDHGHASYCNILWGLDDNGEIWEYHTGEGKWEWVGGPSQLEDDV